MIMPPKTSQTDPEKKPENTTFGGAIARTTHKKKKIRAVRYSSRAAVESRPIVNTMTAMTRMLAGAQPAGAGNQKTNSAASAAARAMNFDTDMSGAAPYRPPHRRNHAASPRKAEKATTSVIVVRKTLDAIAGSIPVRYSPRGIIMPASAAITSVMTMATAITAPTDQLPDQNQATKPINKAKRRPL